MPYIWTEALNAQQALTLSTKVGNITPKPGDVAALAPYMGYTEPTVRRFFFPVAGPSNIPLVNASMTDVDPTTLPYDYLTRLYLAEMLHNGCEIPGSRERGGEEKFIRTRIAKDLQDALKTGVSIIQGTAGELYFNCAVYVQILDIDDTWQVWTYMMFRSP